MSQQSQASNAGPASGTTATDASDDESAREVQVLEFKLGAETYCVDIDYVSEIVDRGSLTAVPNAPEYVDGVMDLRGRTTSIVNPQALLNVDAGDSESKRIVIFDPGKFEDDAAIGWLVDEVYQVIRVSMDEVEDPPLEKDDAIEGVIKRDGELVIWISPVGAVASE
jgi:purine-binding chemotaxis protein CheW